MGKSNLFVENSLHFSSNLYHYLGLQDGISKPGKSQVLVIGATNRPMDLDSAALRRFGQHIYVPLPDREVNVSQCLNECLNRSKLLVISSIIIQKNILLW